MLDQVLPVMQPCALSGLRGSAEQIKHVLYLEALCNQCTAVHVYKRRCSHLDPVPSVSHVLLLKASRFIRLLISHEFNK